MDSFPVTSDHAVRVLNAQSDPELRLQLDAVYGADHSPWSVPAYRFHIVANGQRAGTVSLRIGANEQLVKVAGHIGFGIGEPFRGRRLAGRAVRSLMPLAASHGVNPLWLGCNPDNKASMAVMKWLGAIYVETVDLTPDDHRYYSRGERQKRRYRLDY